MPVATSTPKLVPRAAALSASAAISAAASVSPSATAAAQGTKPIISEQARRLVIAYYFVEILDPPDKVCWDTPVSGTISTTIRELKIPAGSRQSVKMVLQGVVACWERGEEYDGERRSDAYLRVYDPVTGGSPTPERIIEDVKKFISSCESIRLARGCLVPGLGKRNGRRAELARGAAHAARGGLRTKGSRAPSKWLHSDAVGAKEQILALARQRAGASR